MSTNAKSSRSLARLGFAAAGLLATTAMVQAADVSFDRLSNPEPENWLSYSRTYDGHRYSPLDEINTGNVAGLHVSHMLPLALPEAGGFAISSLHATALVDNGTMFMVDGWGRVYGIDLTAGDRAFIRWVMDPQTPRETDGITNNRGVALLDNMVYSIGLDGYLFGTDSATGELAWAVPTEQNPVEYFTMAPLAIDGKILMGPAGGDGPMRGRLEARDPANGDLIWTFHTIPGPGEPGSETWVIPETAEIGGGAVWATGSYDVNQNLVVWGIGNPQPDWDPTLRPGDNLYTDSTVALNADTGELVWYFQYTPNDSWDYDEVGSQLLYEVDGRSTLAHFGRNGFFYQLDAVTGEFINGGQYVEQLTWSEGLDPKTGKPVEYDPNLDVQLYRGNGEMIELPGFGGAAQMMPDRNLNFCPYWEGGVNFYPTSYSERTGYAYGSAMEGCNDFATGFAEFGQVGGVTGDTPLTGSVTAVDSATGAVVGRHSMPYIGRAGVLSTAGGLVFSASLNGDFFALNDETMEVLWNFNTGTGIEAPPISFAVNGKQYIALPVGPGGVGADFHRYAEHGDDPNASAMANANPAAIMLFFSL